MHETRKTAHSDVLRTLSCLTLILSFILPFDTIPPLPFDSAQRSTSFFAHTTSALHRARRGVFNELYLFTYTNTNTNTYIRPSQIDLFGSWSELLVSYIIYERRILLDARQILFFFSFVFSGWIILLYSWKVIV